MLSKESYYFLNKLYKAPPLHKISFILKTDLINVIKYDLVLNVPNGNQRSGLTKLPTPFPAGAFQMLAGHEINRYDLLDQEEMYITQINVELAQEPNQPNSAWAFLPVQCSQTKHLKFQSHIVCDHFNDTLQCAFKSEAGDVYNDHTSKVFPSLKIDPDASFPVRLLYVFQGNHRNLPEDPFLYDIIFLDTRSEGVHTHDKLFYDDFLRKYKHDINMYTTIRQFVIIQNDTEDRIKRFKERQAFS